MSPKLEAIFETIPFNNPTISEVEVNGKKYMRVKGVFGRADERNANNRIYTSKLIERETKGLAERSTKDTVFMQADHPTDGVSRISDTAAILRSVTYDPSTKEVTGEADILTTRKGTDLAEIVRAGGKVGISARGFGTTSVGEHAGQKGDIVNDDYKLVTYDFVVGQSTRNAVVTNFAEQAEAIASLTQEGETDMDLKTLNIEELKAARPDLMKAIEQGAKDAAKVEAEKAVTAMVAEKSAEIETRLREELKLEAKKKKDSADDPDMEEMMAVAATLGYTLEAKTATPKQRYGGGKGRSGQGTEDNTGSDAEDQKDHGADEANEQSLVAFAKKHNLKLEKKSAQRGSENKDVEERFNQLQATLRDTQAVMEQTEARSKALQEQIAANDVKAYIFEKCKDERKYKTALTERLLAAGLKTKEDVDARIPVEKLSIERLMVEASGEGRSGKEEPVGSADETKTFKTKDGKILTEAEVRQRNLAGIQTELVEQSQ
jgi:hypothetical protein